MAVIMTGWEGDSTPLGPTDQDGRTDPPAQEEVLITDTDRQTDRQMEGMFMEGDPWTDGLCSLYDIVFYRPQKWILSVALSDLEWVMDGQTRSSGSILCRL